MDFPSENWVYNDWTTSEGLRQRGGGLHAGELHPDEEHRPHPRQFPALPRRLQATGHTALHGWALIPLLQNQLAAKFVVPSINNQSYFQHTIITLRCCPFRVGWCCVWRLRRRGFGWGACWIWNVHIHPWICAFCLRRHPICARGCAGAGFGTDSGKKDCSVAYSDNQSYYQHTIVALADSNNQSYYQHTIVALADSNN
jgi:hypothetical protein